jgi:enolase
MSDIFGIKKVEGLEILDSRGNFTVRSFVTTKGGIKDFGDAPAGASKGEREAVELRDKDGEVINAIHSIDYYINYALANIDIRNQDKIDRIMVELDGTENKSRLGANAIISTSIAVAKTAAKAMEVEVFDYIGGFRSHKLPIPLLNILNGGMHAGNELKIQEFLIIPTGFSTFSDAIKASTTVYKTLKNLITERYGKIYTALGDEGGVAPPLTKTEDALDLVYAAIKNSGYDNEFYLGMDAASSDFYDSKSNTYEIDGTKKTPDEMLDFYKELCERYPILYLEDPFDENDFEGFSKLQAKLPKVIITGDDLYTTNIKYLKKGIEMKSTTGVIVKLNQIGTITETLDFFDLARQSSIKTVISHRSGETEDNFIADLAVGLNSDFIKTGAPARGERTSKYNRLLEIEKEYKFKYNKI